MRKEYKGGRSFTKLGYVDINLAEFAGLGDISRKSILEEYDTRHRLANSVLKYSFTITLISGDLLFRL